MGVLNVTPDSFSDGGQLYREGQPDLSVIVDTAARMVADGVDILDVGGESTRPGATSVSLQEELDRVLPVVEALVRRFPVVVSIDTSSAALMREGTRLGAGMINDVRALTRPGAMEAAVEGRVPVCLMHMQGEPSSMQREPRYTDVVAEVLGYLESRVAACVEAGLSRDRLVVDPGIGFGKALDHNLSLFNSLQLISEIGLPVLVGASRKSMIGAITGRSIDERLAGSLALVALAALRGASIIRVHDVAESRDVVEMISAVTRGSKQ